MKRLLHWLSIAMITATTVSCATVPNQQTTNTSPAATTNKVAATKAKASTATSTNKVVTVNTNAPGAASTNVAETIYIPEFSLTNTTKDLEHIVLQPPTSEKPVPIIPSYIDREPTPKLSSEALKHQYLGFRLGMSPEEAALVAQGKEKKLDEIEKGRKYQLDGCLTEVPDKGKTVLTFKDGKLDVIMIYWDDNNTLFIQLEQGLIKKYGRALKVDELFRRYWELANGDWVRLFYNVGSHQTSLVYASKKSLFEMSEKEKQDSAAEIPGL
jgi:hypothetical protein